MKKMESVVLHETGAKKSQTEAKASRVGKPAFQTPAEIDAEILRLMELRAELTVSALEDPAKEAETNGNDGGNGIENGNTRSRRKKMLLADECKESVLHDIRSLCDSLVRPKNVAFLGPLFSFTHQAALKFFGSGAHFSPVSTIGSVFEEVERGQCDFGIVPVENSTDGRVVDALETFTHSKVQICGEVDLPIHHTLMGLCGRSEIQVVLSKPQALSQCRHWLAKHLPGVRMEETASTAAAAQIAKETPNAAAIASILAAKAYGLNVLVPEVEDSRFNVTRFVVLGKEDAPKTPRSKTMLMFELPHEVGALADAMMIFKKNRVNLPWIESFPIQNEPGRYIFFVDMEGHRSQMKIRRTLAALERKHAKIVVLGSYPAAEQNRPQL